MEEHLSRGNGSVVAGLRRYKQEWEVNKEGILTEEEMAAKSQRWEMIWGREEGEKKPTTKEADQTILEVMKYEEGMNSYECLRKVGTIKGRKRIERARIQRDMAEEPERYDCAMPAKSGDVFSG